MPAFSASSSWVSPARSRSRLSEAPNPSSTESHASDAPQVGDQVGEWTSWSAVAGPDMIGLSPPAREHFNREDCSSMSNNKETIRRYYEEVFNQGKLEVLDEIVARDHVEHNP